MAEMPDAHPAASLDASCGDACCGGAAHGHSHAPGEADAHAEADSACARKPAPCGHGGGHGDGKVGCGCRDGVPVFDGLDPRYKRVLWTVIALNGGMFFLEIAAGSMAGSQALKADALDFLGDTLTYGLSLAVIGAAARVRAGAAMFKGLSLTLMALFVLGSTLYESFILGLPRAEVMGSVGLLALGVNLASVLLLMRYKDGDSNVRSVWLCSRNDAIGNVVVIGAALAVWGSTSPWPDLAVATFMAALFLSSSLQILRQAWREYGTQGVPARPGLPAE